MTEKVSKARAHYRAGSRNRNCGMCTMFQPPDGCTAVTGEVSAGGDCDFYKRKGGSKARSSEWYAGKSLAKALGE